MLWESSIKAKWYLPKLFLFYLEPHNIILSRLPNLWVDFIEIHNSACYLIKMSQRINKSNFPKYYITSTYVCTHMACMVSYSVFSVLDLHHSPGCQNTAIDYIYNHVYLSPGSPWNIVRELTGVPVHPPPPPPWSSVSGTILFRGPSGIILAMLPEKNWDSLLISAIFQNGRLKIWDFQYLGNYFM